MGCAVVIKYCITRINNIKGVIFISPMCGVHESIKPNWIKIKLLLFLAYFIPNTPLISSTKNLSQIVTKNKKYLKLKSKNKYFYTGKHRLCTGREIFNVTNWINKNSHKFDTPILIFHSKEDTITDPIITKDFYNNIKSENKKLYLLENGSHCLFIKDYKDSILPQYVINKILLWLR